MSDELLQPAATIAAGIIAAQINAGTALNKRSIPISPGGIQKLFVTVYRELQAAQTELKAKQQAT